MGPVGLEVTMQESPDLKTWSDVAIASAEGGPAIPTIRREWVRLRIQVDGGDTILTCWRVADISRLTE